MQLCVKYNTICTNQQKVTFLKEPFKAVSHQGHRILTSSYLLLSQH